MQGDIGDHTLRQVEVYGASYIVEMGSVRTDLLMDYHSALAEAEMIADETGAQDFSVCRLSLDPFTEEVVQTIWTGHVINGTATAFLYNPDKTNSYNG